MLQMNLIIISEILQDSILYIERSHNLNKNYTYIILRVNPSQKESYCLNKKDRNITIQATTAANLVFGVNAFFRKYTSLNFKEKK